jgi:hypothetical protein
MTSSYPMADSAILAIASNIVAARCGVVLFQTHCLFFSKETTKPRLQGRGFIGVNAALHECTHGPFPRRN